MDFYLTAMTDALADRTSLDYDRQSVENAYYARHFWTPTVPVWVGKLAILAIHLAATIRTPLARHA